MKIISPVNGLFMGLIAVYLLLFAVSLTSFISKAPSEKISREFPLTSLEYGFSKSCNCHVTVLPYPERESALVIGVDGGRTRFMDLDIRGEILRDISLDLDLSRASDIKMFSPAYNHIILYYLYKGLRKVDIDLSAPDFSEELLVENTADFSLFHDRVVFKQPDGLYGSAAGADTVKLVDGEVESFSLTGDETGYPGDSYLLYTTGSLPSDKKLNLLSLDRNLRIMSRRRIRPEGEGKFYSDIVDTSFVNGVLSSLFLLASRNLRLNELSLLRMDAATGELQQSFTASYPLYKSRYRIIDSNEDELRFIHQIDDGRGVNLGVTTVSSTGGWEVYPYSKTLSMSKYGGFFQAEGYEALIFSDIDYDKRQLLFASSEPQIVEETTKWSSVGFLYPVLTTLALFLVSLVTGSLYLLVSAPVPLAFCGLMNFLSAPFRRDALNIVVVALIHLLIKMIISYSLIDLYGNYRFVPLLIGRGGVIYPVLVLSSIISYILTIRVNRGQSYREGSYVDFYVRFGLYDYMQYVSLVLIYIMASVLLTKI